MYVYYSAESNDLAKQGKAIVFVVFFCFFFLGGGGLFYKKFSQQVRVGGRNKNKIHSDHFPIEFK